jgi:hypothetical protein
MNYPTFDNVDFVICNVKEQFVLSKDQAKLTLLVYDNDNVW